MPLPQVWGPIAWNLLHSIGARAGKGKQPRLRADEQREVFWLLAHLEYIIPCPECRQHIIAYRKANGLPTSPDLIGSWIWNFHEAVNERLKKEAGPPFTHSLGLDINPAEIWKSYKLCVKESFQLGHLSTFDVKEWGRHFLLWLCAL